MCERENERERERERKERERERETACARARAHTRERERESRPVASPSTAGIQPTDEGIHIGAATAATDHAAMSKVYYRHRRESLLVANVTGCFGLCLVYHMFALFWFVFSLSQARIPVVHALQFSSFLCSSPSWF